MDRRNNVIKLSNAVALQLVSAVRAVKIGVDQDVPHLTKDFIAKYVSDVQLLDVLTS